MITVEANTQQILNMGSQVEKLQHKVQHLPTTTAEQLEAERVRLDEMKRAEIQNVDRASEDHIVNPDAGGNNRRRSRIRKPSVKPPEEAESSSEIVKELSPHGRQINLIV